MEQGQVLSGCSMYDVGAPAGPGLGEGLPYPGVFGGDLLFCVEPPLCRGTSTAQPPPCGPGRCQRGSQQACRGGVLAGVPWVLSSWAHCHRLQATAATLLSLLSPSRKKV